jgi:hypothetical protein
MPLQKWAFESLDFLGLDTGKQTAIDFDRKPLSPISFRAQIDSPAQQTVFIPTA